MTKKFTFFFCLLFITLFPFICGCENKSPLLDSVSLLRQDIYCGEFGDKVLNASFGFREYPFCDDGKAGEKVYYYDFKLSIIPDEVKRTVELTLNGKDYSADFKLDPVSSEYKAEIETDNIRLSEFTVNVKSGSENCLVTLRSLIPENCISYEKAITCLEKDQKSLISAFSSDGKFNAEIYLKIFVKNQKPYWYVALLQGNGKLKALLLDGLSGETLAIRDIF